MDYSKKQKPRSLFGVIVVLCGFLFFLPLGNIHSYGNMAPYIISYTRRYSLDPNREDVELSSSTWLYGTIGVTKGLSIILGGWLIEKIGPRPTASIGAFIFTGSTFLTAGAIKLSFWAVVITYGLLTGVGLGFCYVTPFYSAMQWLPQHTGLAIGLVMMGLGGASFVYIPLQTSFINPSDQDPHYQPDAHLDFFYFTQSDILERVPYMFIILGIIYGTIQLITIPFIPEYREVVPPSKSFRSVVKYIWTVVKPRAVSCQAEKSKPDEEVNRKEIFELTDKTESLGGHVGLNGTTPSHGGSKRPQSVANKTVSDIKPLDLLKRWDFYLMLISNLALTEAMAYFTSQYKVFGESAKYSDHVLAVVGSLASLSDCAGRVLWGLLADQIPCKIVLALTMSGISAFMYTFFVTPILHVSVYALWVVFLSFCFGGSFSVFPACCSVWYGREHVSTNYGMLFSSHSLGSAVAIVVSTYGHHVLGWEGEFLFTASLCFVGVICLLVGGDRKITKKKTQSN